MATKSKKSLVAPSEFNFWKDNSIDQHFTLTESVLKEKFEAWLPTKDIAWINHYNSERIIRFFLTDKQGVSSVFEESEFDAMYEFLKPIVVAHEKTFK